MEGLDSLLLETATNVASIGAALTNVLGWLPAPGLAGGSGASAGQGPGKTPRDTGACVPVCARSHKHPCLCGLCAVHPVGRLP
jgi:hypothetical protein